MLTQERHLQILAQLEEKGTVSVAQLTQLLGASESTVRRDLIALDRLGKLHKVHGGATLTRRDFIRREEKLDEKLQLHMDEKEMIAAYAAAQVDDTDFVYLDAGSSTLLMIDHLQPGATFVTNGLLHAQRLVAKGMKTYVLGGELSNTTVPSSVWRQPRICITTIFPVFHGTNGIAIRQGFTTPDTDEAYLKAAAMERSFVSYVLADASKFDKVSTVSFAPLDQAAIITDRLPDPEYGERTVVKEVALL